MTRGQQFRAIMMPVAVTVIVPLLLLSLTRSANPGWSLPLFFSFLPVIPGVLLIGVGVSLIVQTVSLFRYVGKGTLVPWNPPKHLVVEGVYRYVRNPMITGVGAVLLGEGIVMGSWPLLLWFGLFALANAIYIPRIEEPGLLARFGESYREYCRHVPRWIPRRTPWTPR
jgi:protein-S-isoprenylcysteine O-methyltransferase Ste14